MANLLLIDTTKMQDYIFKSNRLRENIGASYLAAQATGTWILQSLEQVTADHNVDDAAAEKLDPDRRYEDGLEAELIYTGGGNAMIIFRHASQMSDFVRLYSRCLLLNAPGLQLVTAHLPFDWQQTNRDKTMYEEVVKLFDEVAARAKRERLPNNPLLGLGVTAACRSTGLPAVAMAPMVQDDPDSVYPVSAEIEAKLLAATPPRENAPSLADSHLRRQLPLALRDLYIYPSDFDDLGRSLGEQSYIAVVHADGDGIGRRIQQIGADLKLDNRAYITARRDFSDRMKTASRAALLATFLPLLRQLAQDSPAGDKLIHLNGFGAEIGRITLAANKNASRFYLPFRPLVMAGDDLTFVCDGRLGLALAAGYLDHFQQHCQKEMEQAFTASAGVAIVKAHYPFARTYGLAEELIHAAKQYRRDNQPDLQGGCLDWYFTAGGLHGRLQEMREREYKGPDGSLTLRPVALHSQTGPTLNWRSWPTIRRGINAFQDVDPAEDQEEPLWSNRRSKVKALRDALRDGPKATTYFITASGIKKLPRIMNDPDPFQTNGYFDGRCGYFDALELADLFMPVRPSAEDT